MLKKDYFQRMIEEAAEVFARLLGLREAQQYDAAQALLDDTFAGLFDLRAVQLSQTEVEDLIELLGGEGFETPHYTAMAQLLREKAEIHYGKGDWTAGDHALKQGMAIYEYLNDTQPEVYDFSRYNALEAMLKRLEEPKG